MRCAHCRPLLEAYRMGELDEVRSPLVEAHLSGCDDCRRRAESLAVLPVLRSAAPPDWSPPDGFVERVLYAAEEPRTAVEWALGRRPGERRRSEPRLRCAAAAWLWVGFLAGLLAAMPATRRLLLGRDLAELTFGERRLELLPWSIEDPLLKPRRALVVSSPAQRLHSTAEALAEGWAYAALAETLVGRHPWDDQAARRYRTALDESPGEPWLALRYADAVSGVWAQRDESGRSIDPALPATVDAATAEALRLDPNNAVAHYLRAAYLWQAGDEPGFWSALRDGNRAPRATNYTRAAADSMRRLAVASRVTPLPFWATVWKEWRDDAPAPLAGLVESSRQWARRARKQGSSVRFLDQRLELVKTGAWLRERGESVGLREAGTPLVNDALEWTKGELSWVERWQAGGQEMASQLRTLGRAAEADWLMGQVSAHEAAVIGILPAIPRWAYDPLSLPWLSACLGLRWLSWVVVLQAAVLACVGWAARDRWDSLPWRLAETACVALPALLASVVLSGILTLWPVLVGTYNDGSGRALALVVAASLLVLPWLACRQALHRRARQYDRRLGAAREDWSTRLVDGDQTSACRTEFLRAAAPELYLTAAALTAAAALLLAVPSAILEHAFARILPDLMAAFL